MPAVAGLCEDSLIVGKVIRIIEMSAVAGYALLLYYSEKL